MPARRLRPPAHDATLEPSFLARGEHEREPLGGSVRDRHDHFVGRRLRDHLRRLVERARHDDACDAALAHARVVVEEADDAAAGRLAQFPREGTAGAAGADDEDAATLGTARVAAAEHAADGDARADDQHGREYRVEKVDLNRERAQRPALESDDRERTERRHGARDGHRDDVVRPREAPDAAVDPRDHEADVAESEHDRQRGDEDRALLVRSQPVDDERVRDEERRAHQPEVEHDLREAPRLDESAQERDRALLPARACSSSR